jgi:hypothetical protein
MIVSVERKLMETKRKRKQGPPLEPEEIILKITVQKGEASLSIASDGHSAKRLLLNYLRENSLCVDNAAKLFRLSRREARCLWKPTIPDIDCCSQEKAKRYVKGSWI